MGGGAVVCARHLHTWGAQVHVLLATGSEALAPATARQQDILKRMGVASERANAARGVRDITLIVDGIIGCRLADIGVPPGLYAHLLAVSVGSLFARDEIVRLR